MTVAELIKELQKIEDKEKKIVYSDWDNNLTNDSVTAVRDREDTVELYFHR